MKAITISIPKPCHEGWENMTPTQKGKFCSSCQKEVIDFTNMNDKEITLHLQNNNKPCGRFRSSQLNRVIAIPPTRANYYFPYHIAAASLLLLTLPSCGSELNRPRIESTQEKGEIALKDVSNTNVTKGILTNEAGEAISQKPVSIRYRKDDFYFTTTDSKGIFTLPKNIKHENIIEIIVTGKENISIPSSAIKIDQDKSIHIILSSYDEFVLNEGHIMLGMPTIEEKKFKK